MLAVIASCPRCQSAVKSSGSAVYCQPCGWSKSPLAFVKSLLDYETKSEGAPCEKGETAARSGCIPASGDTSAGDSKPLTAAAAQSNAAKPPVTKRLAKPEDSETLQSWTSGEHGKSELIDYSEGTQDLMMASLNKELGYDALPQLVSEEEMNKIIEDGGIELYRGVKRSEDAEAFRTGKFFAGIGMYGNGTYTAPLSYSDTKYDSGYAMADHYAESDQNGVMRMTLSKDAKIASAADMRRVYEEHKQYIRSLYQEASATEDEQQYHQLRRKAIIMEDMGRYMALHGYDGYYTDPDSESGGTFVLLNRGVCVIQKTPSKPVTKSYRK